MSYADALESYLVPAEEALNSETIGKATVITLALAALGIVAHDVIKSRAAKKASKLEAQKRSEDYEAWKNSPATKNAIDYINRKYGINYDGIDESSIKILYKKLLNSVEKDMSKISRKLNSDKKLCYRMSEKCKNDDLVDASDIDDVKSGICAMSPEDHSDNYKNIEFGVLDTSQEVINVIGDDYYDAFSNALNIKYEKEIQLRIISKFSMQGDGDEGIVGCKFLIGGNKR